MSEWKGPAIQGAGDIGAAIIGAAASKKEGKRAWRRTKVLNQNQIQWRVRDAEAAGIHPLAAMGMSPIGQYTSQPQGSVWADALQGATDAAAGYYNQKAATKANKPILEAQLAESRARTAASLAQARADQAQAEWTDQQRLNSIIARFKSPGRPNTNTPFGETYKLPKTQQIPTYLDPSTRPISQQHAQVLEDVTPGATKGQPVVVHGAGGLEIPVDPSYTPGALIEELLGESGGFISFWNLLHHLSKGTLPADYRPWWYDEKGHKIRRDQEREVERRIWKK